MCIYHTDKLLICVILYGLEETSEMVKVQNGIIEQ